MHSLRTLGILSVCLMALVACEKSSPDATGTQGSSADGAVSGDGSVESSARSSVPLTEKRFQAYVAYRKELHGLYRAFAEDMAKFAKTVDAKSGGGDQMVAAMQGIRMSEKQDAVLKALRKKHGFDEEEDNRLWEAIGAVASAKVIENPSMEPSLKMYRDMQAKGGEEKKAADEFFATLEASEKEGLAQAKDLCGAECVDVLVKHVKEIQDLQLDAVQQLMAGHAPAK